MLKWIPRAVLAAAITAGGVATVVLAQSADAETQASVLPRGPMWADIQIDPAHQHLIIGDRNSGALLVTEYAGKTVREIATGQAIGDLLVAGARLYVSEPQAKQIVAYDTATFAEVATYPMPGGEGPWSMVPSGGKIWFRFEGAGNDGLGSLDPADGGIYIQPNDERTFDRIWNLSVAANRSSRLVATGTVSVVDQRDQVAVVDVATGEPVVRASRAGINGGSMTGATLSPDAGEVVATGSSGVLRLNGDTLETTGTYPVTAGGARPLFTTAGTLLFPEPENLAYLPPTGKGEIVRTPFARTGQFAGHSVVDMVVEPGTLRAFAITSGTSLDTGLQQLTPPGKEDVTAELSAPARVQPGKAVTLTGRVSSNVADLPLQIVRGDGVRLGPITPGADGTFTVTDTAPSSGPLTYTLTIAETEDREGTTATATVAVEGPAATTLTFGPKGTTYDFAQRITFTVHLGNTYKNRQVSIHVQPAGQEKRLLASAPVDGRGNLSVPFRGLVSNTKVTVTYAGDEWTRPASASGTVYARTQVTTTIAKQYKTKKSGTRTVYVFRKKTNPVLTTNISWFPTKRKQYLTIEYYSAGKWRMAKSGWYALVKNQKSTVTFTGTKKTGVTYRFRGAYISGKSGDAGNATTYSAYRYFTFTK